MFEAGFVKLAAMCAVLSVVGAFTALKDSLSGDDKRNLFLLSSVFALWSIVALLAAILAAVSQGSQS